jgi:hypothetical protein
LPVVPEASEAAHDGTVMREIDEYIAALEQIESLASAPGGIEMLLRVS